MLGLHKVARGRRLARQVGLAAILLFCALNGPLAALDGPERLGARASSAVPLRSRSAVKPQPITSRFPVRQVTRLVPRVREPIEVIKPRSRPAPTQPAAQPLTKKQFHAGLWHYLTASRSRYERWGTIARQSDMDAAELAKLASPHGDTLGLFANMALRVNPPLAMHGSIVVREEHRRGLLSRVNVMYRARDYDEENFDWYWIQYLPTGELATAIEHGEPRAQAGRVQSCIGCHRQAEGEDLLFSNDPNIAAEFDANLLHRTFKPVVP